MPSNRFTVLFTILFQPSRILAYALPLVALLALVVPAAQAQDATPLYIEITRTDLTPEDTAAFLDALEERLEAHPFDPVFIEADELGDYPFFREKSALHLTLVPLDDAVGLLVTPYTTLKLEPSDTLNAAFGVTSTATIEPDDANSLDAALDMVTALALYADQNCADALPLFDALAQNETDSSGFTEYQPLALRFYAATCALVAGDLETAAQVYPSIIEAMTDSRIGYSISASTNLAWIYLQQDRNDDAFLVMDELIEAVEASDNDYWLTQALMRQSQIDALAYQYDEAIAAMDRAIEIADADPIRFPATYRAVLYTERGLRILLLYEWDRVLDQYNRAIELDPTYAPAYFNRGVLYYTQGPRERAIEDFQTYLALNPEGDFADEAREYIADIPVEMEALDAPLATEEASS